MVWQVEKVLTAVWGWEVKKVWALAGELVAKEVLALAGTGHSFVLTGMLPASPVL
jgi:hypothetical protein